MPKTRNRKTAQNAEPAVQAPSEPIRPGGKLGLVVQRLASKQGATLDQLSAATGWQPHTVRGALSRLRARGFPAELVIEGERKVYRLSQAKG